VIYDIAVRLRYTYDPPAPAGRNLLRLRPMDLPGRQRVVAAEVLVRPPPVERADRRDFFGNAVTETVHRQPVARTEFSLRARVDRLADPAALDLSPPVAGLAAEITGVQSLAPDTPHHFTAPSPRVPADAAIAAFARAAADGAPSTSAAMEAVALALHRRMVFDAEATTVDTPASLAFALGRGVCQDIAHIMLSGLRSLGIPAAYVSGLLRTVPPPGQPRLDGADAMHAWVRAWCGLRMGWVEFDPTNACPAAEGHIAVAVGRDYDDVAPVQGVLRAAGLAEGSQSVDVVALG
jgi:transglutaminase-like putative cysteine protease